MSSLEDAKMSYFFHTLSRTENGELGQEDHQFLLWQHLFLTRMGQ